MMNMFFLLQPLVVTHSPEIRLPNAPDYPGLQYPPIFEPGSYSLSDVSNLLWSSRVRNSDHGGEDVVVATSSTEGSNAGFEQGLNDSLNNNVLGNEDRDENHNSNRDDGP